MANGHEIGGEFPGVEDIIEAEEGAKQTDAGPIVNPDIVKEDEERAEKNINRVEEAIKTSGEEARTTIENDPNLSEEERRAKLEILGQAVARVEDLAMKAFTKSPTGGLLIISAISFYISIQIGADWNEIGITEMGDAFLKAAGTLALLSSTFTALYALDKSSTVHKAYGWVQDKKNSFQKGYSSGKSEKGGE